MYVGSRVLAQTPSCALSNRRRRSSQQMWNPSRSSSKLGARPADGSALKGLQGGNDGRWGIPKIRVHISFIPPFEASRRLGIQRVHSQDRYVIVAGARTMLGSACNRRPASSRRP